MFYTTQAPPEINLDLDRPVSPTCIESINPHTDQLLIQMISQLPSLHVEVLLIGICPLLVPVGFSFIASAQYPMTHVVYSLLKQPVIKTHTMLSFDH